MIYVNLAPPTLGAWSMAGLLGQPLDYYYVHIDEPKITETLHVVSPEGPNPGSLNPH